MNSQFQLKRSPHNPARERSDAHIHGENIAHLIRQSSMKSENHTLQDSRLEISHHERSSLARCELMNTWDIEISKITYLFWDALNNPQAHPGVGEITLEGPGGSLVG